MKILAWSSVLLRFRCFMAVVRVQDVALAAQICCKICTHMRRHPHKLRCFTYQQYPPSKYFVHQNLR